MTATDHDAEAWAPEWYPGMLVRTNTTTPTQWVEQIRDHSPRYAQLPLHAPVLPLGSIGVLQEYPDTDDDDHANTLVLFDGKIVATEIALDNLSRVVSRSEIITPEEASQVLHGYTGEGYAPGSFVKSLLVAMKGADSTNLGRLQQAFRGYAMAVDLAKNHNDGLDRLREIARG